MSESRLCAAVSILALSAAAPMFGPAAAHGQQWRLHQDLEIGTTDATALTQVGGIVVARDGSFFVLQPASAEVLIFSADGSRHGSIGRDGDGPGEFRALSRAGMLGDTLWVSDSRLRRITYFSRDGELLRVTPAVPAQASSNHLPVMPAVITPAGETALAVSTAVADHIESGRVRYLPLLHFNLSDGRVIGEAGRTATENRMIALRYPNGGGMFGPQPFSDAPLAEPFPDGTGFAVVDRSAAPRAGRHSFRVTRLAPQGDTIWQRVFDYTATPMNPDLANEKRAELTAFLARRLGNERQAERMVGDALYVPANAPPVTRLVPGRDGTIWLRREEQRTAVTWDILGPNGRLLGSLAARPDLEIMEADLGNVWGTVRDAFDVPSVVRYRLIR